MELTDRGWKEFYIKDIFNYVERGKRLTKKTHTTGTIPYVSSSAQNNGVNNFISNTNQVRLFSNCISLANSGSVGSSFYHPYTFVASDHVTHLKNDSFNEAIYVFITVISSRLSSKYNFNLEINDKRISKEKIMLPVNDLDNPDYSFMEEYVREEEKYKKEKYIAYAKKQLKTLQYVEIPILKEKVWDEFSVGGDNGIFTISSGKRLTKADMDNGYIPFIGATDSNNGITNWVGTPNSTLDSNVLGVNYNGSVVENFYHPYLCVFSDDVKRLHLKNHKDNKYILLFFKSIILNQKSKYTYGYKFNAHRMERQKILLPLTDQGSPDYAYMEQYAKNLTISKLKKYLSFVGQKAAQS